jgi:parvulin-like peptidyl-prolyl isomerase
MNSVTITKDRIIRQVKNSYQMPDIINDILKLQVIKETSQEIGIEVTDEELQQRADNIRLISDVKTADETLIWLDNHGLTLDDFEEIVHTTLLYDVLAQHLFTDRIEKYFVEHQLEYMGVAMYEIIFDNEEITMEYYLAIQGEEVSFFDIAHQYIADAELRRQCGYRGILRRRDLKPTIASVVFGAESPRLLKPIKSTAGYHLILIDEIIKPELTENLKKQIQQELFVDWLEQKVQTIDITTNL